MSYFIHCTYLAEPEEITEIAPIYGGANEYSCCVILRDTDWQLRAVSLIVQSKDLGRFIFATEDKPW